MEKKSSFLAENKSKAGAPTLYRADGTFYESTDDSSITIRVDDGKDRIVTGTFPSAYQDPGELIEIIRDSEDPGHLVFLRWKDGDATFFHSVERKGYIFVSPDLTSRCFPSLSLPNGLSPCGEVAELFSEIRMAISRFIKLRMDQSMIVAAFILATWFVDLFESAPYLWVVGPWAAGKTQLLKIMRCLCRRGFLAGDMRSGSLYRVMDTWEPTLILDESELGTSHSNSELLRMLRAGSVRGAPVIRNGHAYSIYGMKIISSRLQPGDSALLSRGPVIAMFPNEEDLELLDESAMRSLEDKFQAKLCMFRLTKYLAVKNCVIPSNELQNLSPRMKQIARSLISPTVGNLQLKSELLHILAEYYDNARDDRSLEPEWLVAEALFANSHKGIGHLWRVSELPAGSLAEEINYRLKSEGEKWTLSARGVGAILKNLGLRTEELGRLHRGLRLSSRVQRKIHEVAAQFGINRRNLLSPTGLETGYGGAPCALCEEFGLTAGLRFVDPYASLPLRPGRSRLHLTVNPDQQETQSINEGGDGKPS